MPNLIEEINPQNQNDNGNNVPLETNLSELINDGNLVFYIINNCDNIPTDCLWVSDKKWISDCSPNY